MEIIDLQVSNISSDSAVVLFLNGWSGWWWMFNGSRSECGISFHISVTVLCQPDWARQHISCLSNLSVWTFAEKSARKNAPHRQILLQSWLINTVVHWQLLCSERTFRRMSTARLHVWKCCIWFMSGRIMNSSGERLQETWATWRTIVLMYTAHWRV